MKKRKVGNNYDLIVLALYVGTFILALLTFIFR